MSLPFIQNIIYKKLLDVVSMDSIQSTVGYPIQPVTCYCFQSSWTGFNGDSTARITTYASNDDIIYTQIDAIAPTGTTGSYMLNVEKAAYRFVKLIYTQTSGSGNLTVTISGKAI